MFNKIKFQIPSFYGEPFRLIFKVKPSIYSTHCINAFCLFYMMLIDNDHKK